MQSPQLGDAGFERLALARERRHGAAVFFDAVAIDPSERRRRAVRASQLPQIVDVEQQPPVARAAHLVQLHEARFDVGTLPIRLPLQRLRARGRRVELTLNAAGLRLDRGELFRFDLSIQFELAELNEQRLLLRSERFRLTLERRETIRRALRQGFGLGAVGRRGRRRLSVHRNGDSHSYRQKCDGHCFQNCECHRFGASRTGICHRCR